MPFYLLFVRLSQVEPHAYPIGNISLHSGFAAFLYSTTEGGYHFPLQTSLNNIPGKGNSMCEDLIVSSSVAVWKLKEGQCGWNTLENEEEITLCIEMMF